MEGGENMNKTILSLVGSALLLSSTVMPAVAAGKSAPKATGGVGYTAYSTTQRNAEFNAISTSACSTANITGSYTITFDYLGSLYPHHATLTQTGTSVTGSGGYPVGGPDAYSWNATGTVTGNTVNLTANYTLGAPGTVMTMTGTIASDGSMSGTWQDNFGGVRTGTWSTPAGSVSPFSGCTGKGNFTYSDADGYTYTVSVQFVNVQGNTAWFAGPVTSGNVGTGSWLFAKVVDNGEPGKNVDQIWGSFTTEAAAKFGVANKLDPADGPFTISSGNLQVQ